MSTAEIIAELPRLTPDELAEIRAKLRELALARSPAITSTARAAQVRSPRLARPEQSQDFVKFVGSASADGMFLRGKDAVR